MVSPDPAPDASLGEVISAVTADLSLLMRKELELAKVEIRDEVTKSAKAGGMFGGAGIAAYLAVVLLSFAAAVAFGNIIPLWGGFLVVAGIYLVIGAVLFLNGREKMRLVRPVPEQTIETLKEDVRWAKRQAS